MHPYVLQVLAQLDALIEELALTQEVLGTVREVYMYDQAKQLILDREEAQLVKMRKEVEEIKTILVAVVQLQSSQN